MNSIHARLPQYTLELNKLLHKLTSSFSEMKKPSPERFLYRPRFNRKGELRPADDKTAKAFEILGDSQGAIINASNIVDMRILTFYLEKDAMLWITPIFLKALQEWWCIKLNKIRGVESSVHAIELESREIKAIQELRLLMHSISGNFCDVYENERSEELDPNGYALKIQLKNAEIYNLYMTEDMRVSLKNILLNGMTLWGERRILPSWI